MIYRTASVSVTALHTQRFVSLPHAIHQLWLLTLLAVLSAGCGGSKRQPSDGSVAADPANRHPTMIRTPIGPHGVPSGTFDENGRPVMIACATCHSTRPANADAKLGTPLAQFHQGLVGKHGTLSCTSCHTPTDGYASLRLADGKKLPYSDVMTLCAQCHGPQFRDYQHGAHGGMTGYWDLLKGGRVRNTCTDCHDPHAPKYPTVTPTSSPNDRFQTRGVHE